MFVLTKKYQLNTNFILLSCFLAHHRIPPLEADVFHQLLSLTQRWYTEVVIKLREVREHIKALSLPPILEGSKLTVKKKINEAELLSEAVEQALLYEAIQSLLSETKTTLTETEIAQQNLYAYLQANHCKLTQEDTHLLSSLISSILETANNARNREEKINYWY